MRFDMSITNDFIDGARHLIKGFKFLASHLSLWPWAFGPLVINLVLLGLLLTAFSHYYGDIYGWVSAHLGEVHIPNPDAWYWHILNALLWVVNLLFQLLVVIVSFIIMAIVSYAVGLVAASPFNDALSERVEVMVTGMDVPPFVFGKFLRDIVRVVKVEAIKAILFLAIPVVLLVIAFIPVVGGPLYVILTFVFGAWGTGFAYVDLPMGRRVAPFRERLGLALSNRWALVGFGVGFVIPFFNLLFAAPMVVGGTLLYVDRTSHASRVNRLA